MEKDFGQEITLLLNEKYGGQMTEEAKEDIGRIRAGEPVDYVIGWTEFLGCKIDLSARPFIPRTETEYWVEKAIDDVRADVFSGALPHISPAGSTWAPTRLRKNIGTDIGFTYVSPKISIPLRSRMPLRENRGTPIKCLDLFAGSGCIGIAVLKYIPWAKVDFAEKGKKFLKQIEINTKLNGIAPERYRIVQSDVFSNVKGKYDYILANPPYIPQKSKHQVEESVLQWEPHGALFGGEDGLDYVRILIEQGRDHLNEGGKIYVEFDSPTKKDVEEILLKQKLLYCFCKDQFGKWRYVVVERE
ncbi:MAG: methyltransferase [Candidatus Wildermuthbacteria bacterium]|nr:methyltransferase [Candidatus Wildermuthbacteria bacterium]